MDPAWPIIGKINKDSLGIIKLKKPADSCESAGFFNLNTFRPI
jgi:hypothetical protein